MSEKDRRKFVVDFMFGKIYTSQMIENECWDTMMLMVFMPLALGAIQELTPEEAADIGIIWEYTDNASPRSINGHPIFLSMRIMHKVDWNKISPQIEKRLKALKQFEEGDPDVTPEVNED